VRNTAFHGETLDECHRYIDYLYNCPECYKTTATKCISIGNLKLKTDFEGSVPVLGITRTAQRSPKSDKMGFHTRQKFVDLYN